MKGFNLLSCLVRYGDVSLPVGFEIVKKDITFLDPETGKPKRRASITKNEHFRNLLKQCEKNRVLYRYILADSWFGAKDNMEYIHFTLQKYFIFGVKSNRTVALSLHDKQRGNFQPIKSLDLAEERAITVYLKDMSFPVQLVKKSFTNEDGSTGVLYLVTNDFTLKDTQIYGVYQKRWRIEEYHKSIKQNASLAKSPTQTIRSQQNHIFASLIAYCKLEGLKIKTRLNHFALKSRLLLRANQLVFQELQLLKQQLLLSPSA